ncbi:MAG TPA: hypothetical protein VGH28_29045 [Polyangiaceae bacterium]|jgi:hypothetical protein
MQHQSSSSRTSVEAEVFDLGPRAGPLAMVAPALLLAAVLLGGTVGAVLGLTAWFALLAYDARPQRKPRKMRVFYKLGQLVIPGRGKLRAHDIIGATTARHDGRVSLMLAHKKRRNRPVILDFDDEAALIAFCRALGIGHHGFGWVDMAVAAPPNTALRIGLAALLAPVGLIAFALPRDLTPLLGMLGSVGVFVWLAFLLSTWKYPAQVLRLTNGGAFLPNGKWSSGFVGFDRIDDVKRNREGLLVMSRAPDGSTATVPVTFRTSSWNRFAPTPEEVAHVESQLRAAIDRAHGNAAPERGREAFATVIDRAPGESLREWLARVDTIAIGGSGYRSSATASRDELWSLLEDADASPNARAAAARLLSRVAPDELRVRVADVLLTVRDERARVRIASTFDEDALAQEEQLERLEQLKPGLGGGPLLK